MLAKLKGWRTVAFHVAYGAPAAALALLDELKAIDISPLLPAARAAQILAAIALAGVLLRLVTTTRVGKPD